MQEVLYSLALLFMFAMGYACAAITIARILYQAGLGKAIHDKVLELKQKKKGAE